MEGMRGQGGDGGLDVLRAIGDDLARRNEAKKILTSALTSYFGELPRDPAGLPNSILMLAEIWGRYAVALYDSLAGRHFAGTPIHTEMLFGEFGELYGGTTISQVNDVLTTLRIRPGQDWSVPNFSQNGDSLEMVTVMRELGRAVAASPYSFGWLLQDEWFTTEIRKSVSDRVDHWRMRFEQRFGSNSDSIQASRLASVDLGTTVSGATRQQRRGILRRYRETKGIRNQEDLARHLGVSLTALHGMVRRDRSRYSEETLREVLKKMNVSLDQW